MPNLSSAVKLLAIARNSVSSALAVTHHAISPKLPPSSNIFSPARQTCASTDTHLRSATTRCSSLTLLSPLPHLTLRPLTPLPWKRYTPRWQYQGLPLPRWFFYLALIFCPSRGRGLAVSCLSARQFYLSITKPSAVLQWPQHCINPLSAGQPSITPLSITSDPSSAHLSRIARARRWSPRRAPLASRRGWRGQRGRRKLEGNAETEDGGEAEKIIPCPSLPFSSLSLHPAESILFMSVHAY